VRVRYSCALLSILSSSGSAAPGLQWLAVDWDAGTVGVTHGVKRIKNRDSSSAGKTRLVVGELKTAKSRRTVALTCRVADRRS
jgi:hypothetical protein